MKLFLNHKKFPEYLIASARGNWRIRRDGGVHIVEHWERGRGTPYCDQRVLVKSPSMDKAIQKVEHLLGSEVKSLMAEVDGEMVDLFEGDGEPEPKRRRGSKLNEDQRAAVFQAYLDEDEDLTKDFRCRKIGTAFSISVETVRRIIKEFEEMRQAA